MEILFFLKKISLTLRNQGFYLHFLSFFRENLLDFLCLIYGNRLTYFSFFNIKDLLFWSKTFTIKVVEL